MKQCICLGDFNLFEIQRLQHLHFITHEIEVYTINLPRNLQVLHLRVILVGRDDGVFQVSGGGVDDDILPAVGIVAHEVAFPRRDAFADERQGVFPRAFLLVHADGEVVHLAGDVGEVLVPGEGVGHSAYGDAEERGAALHGLRHDDGPPFVAGAAGCGCRLVHVAGRGHRAVGQVDGGLAHQVGGQHGLFRFEPLACGEALTLDKSDAGIGHAVLHGQADDADGGGHVGHFAPEEVAGLIAAHLAVLARLVLVALHGEVVGLDAFGFTERIVAVDVDVRVLVFPIEVVGRVPCVCRLVEGVAHVVAAVAGELQGARFVAVEVDDVDAHDVAVAEAVVVDALQGELVDFAGEDDAVGQFQGLAVVEHVVLATREAQ